MCQVADQFQLLSYFAPLFATPKTEDEVKQHSQKCYQQQYPDKEKVNKRNKVSQNITEHDDF